MTCEDEATCFVPGYVAVVVKPSLVARLWTVSPGLQKEVVSQHSDESDISTTKSSPHVATLALPIGKQHANPHCFETSDSVGSVRVRRKIRTAVRIGSCHEDIRRDRCPGGDIEEHHGCQRCCFRRHGRYSADVKIRVFGFKCREGRELYVTNANNFLLSGGYQSTDSIAAWQDTGRM